MSQTSGEPERVLLTGGRGFVGQRLTAALRSRRPEWDLIVCGGPGDQGAGIDIVDENAVSALVARVRPTIVVHLAAVSAVTASTVDPRAAWSVNLGGVLNLTDALRRSAPECHLLHLSSAEVYGRSLASGRPADETALLEPANPYAASKAAGDILVRQCAASGLSATLARPFNHTGPGQSEAFVVPAFAFQVARIEAGLQDPVIRVGSLDEERDFLDVSDVVEAYLALLQARHALPPGEVFNVASGRARRIGDILDFLLASSKAAIRVEVDPARLRASPIPRSLGDAEKLQARTGWRPRVDFDSTLLAILDDCRRSVTQASGA